MSWGIAGFAGALIPGPHTRTEGPPAITIGLVATAIHFDLLLPLDPQTRAAFAFAESDGVGMLNPDAGWLLLGWGAHDFYQSAGSYAQIPAGAVLKGISGDASVLRLEAWEAQDLGQMPGVIPLRLSATGYDALLAFIHAELGPTPRLVAAPGLSAHDAFYAGHSRFSLFATCNVWIGRALRAAGVPLGVWTPTQQSLRLSLWAFR